MPISSKETYLRHREKRIKEASIWAKKNPEKRRAIVRRWYAKNKITINKKQKDWRLKNPIKMRCIVTNNRARRRGALEKIKVSLLENKLIAANGKCQYCGGKCKYLGFDHLIPISRNGKHTIKNLIVCCLKCNQRKKSRTLKEFKEYCARKGYALII